jgi:hypothetical protein
MWNYVSVLQGLFAIYYTETLLFSYTKLPVARKVQGFQFLVKNRNAHGVKTVDYKLKSGYRFQLLLQRANQL